MVSVTRVPELLRKHRSVRRVDLAGSRATGETTPLSDWDFAVETDDFAAVAQALPELVAPLEPLAGQWDPLAERATYMLMLRGPLKVDLIFPREPAEPAPPWEARAETLEAIDAHFWDWILWLAAKRARGRDELVRDELEKMHRFLLGPLGEQAVPAELEEAVVLYLAASRAAERLGGVEVPRALRDEVLPAVCSRTPEAAVADIGDARVAVRSWGSGGPAVLCWHGVGLKSRASAVFAVAAPLLAGEYGLAVAALDAPGFGPSPPLRPSRYHPHALADLVLPLLDALELDRAAFMGFSWGGDVGCHVAARHPERLTALVVLDAGYWDPPFDPRLPYERCVDRYERLVRTTGGVTVAPKVVAAVEHGTAQALPSTTWRGLASSGLPVLLVAQAGAADADLERFASAVPQADLLRPAGVGHDVLGDGGPEVVRAVGEWLSVRA